jgi:hypothetical protein
MTMQSVARRPTEPYNTNEALERGTCVSFSKLAELAPELAPSRANLGESHLVSNFGFSHRSFNVFGLTKLSLASSTSPMHMRGVYCVAEHGVVALLLSNSA